MGEWSTRQPDAQIKELFRTICLRPAMYVGRVDYELATIFLQGLALGFQNWQGFFYDSFLNKDFSDFLHRKYEVGDAIPLTSWSQVLSHSTGWDDLSEIEKLAQLLQDFEDYDNVLIRLTVES